MFVCHRSAVAVHFFVILLVGTAGHLVEPRLVVEVPADGAFDAFLELEGRLPAELALQFAGVDGVAQVVPLAVGDVGDEVLRGAFGTTEKAVNGLDEHLDEVNVPPFVEAADVVRVGNAPPVENEVDGTGMVFDIKPVAYVLAAVGHEGRHAVGVVEGTHKVVGGGFGGRIRGMGGVFRLFGEEGAVEPEGAVHFIGGDVVKEFPLEGAVPCLFCRLKQGQSAEDVGLGKGERVFDAPVHVALCCQVDNAVDGVLPENRLHAGVVADVCPLENVVGRVLHVLQVGEVAGISQLVEVHNPVVRVFLYKQAHDVRADEAGTACDKYSPLVIHDFLLLLMV